jgi:ArsR family metal-binding transcriptional regulator
MREMSVSLCTGRTAFEVQTRRKLNLEEANRKLNARVATKYITIVDIDGAEASIYPSGRMLIKKVKNEEEALTTAEKILKLIETNGESPP